MTDLHRLDPSSPLKPAGWVRAIATISLLGAVGVASWWMWEIAGRPAVDTRTFLFGANVILAGLFAGLVVSLAAHELGHLAVALLLRIPVKGFAVGPLRFGRDVRIPGADGHTIIDLMHSRRALAPRMVSIMLAGPVADLVVAVMVASVAADASLPLGVRGLAGMATGVAAWAGALNLLPFAAGSTRSDGRQLLDWILHPSRERWRIVQVRDMSALVTLARSVGLGPDGQGGDGPALAAARDRFRAAAIDPRPDVAGVAMYLLMAALMRTPPVGPGTSVALEHAADVMPDLPLIEDFAGRREQPADARALFAAFAADSLAGYLLVQSSGGKIPSAEIVECLARLATLAVAADPEWLHARALLAFSWLLRDEPRRARDVVAVHGLQVRGPDDQSFALAIRGWAELQLGDREQAERLADACRRAGGSQFLGRVLEHALRHDLAQEDAT